MMPVTVKLRDVIKEMDLLNEEWRAFLNKRTGELITITSEDQSAVDEDDPSLLADWQQESLPKIKRVLESDDYLELPDKFEIHEWAIMKQYSESRKDTEHQAELIQAIHGPGAFRSFRAAVDRLDLRESWFRFRDDAIEAKAIEWLDSHGIAYERGQAEPREPST